LPPLGCALFWATGILDSQLGVQPGNEPTAERGITVHAVVAHPDGARLCDLLTRAASGELPARTHTVMPLGHVADAHRAVAKGECAAATCSHREHPTWSCAMTGTDHHGSFTGARSIPMAGTPAQRALACANDVDVRVVTVCEAGRLLACGRARRPTREARWSADDDAVKRAPAGARQEPCDARPVGRPAVTEVAALDALGQLVFDAA
jgi:hypothetical protein